MASFGDRLTSNTLATGVNAVVNILVAFFLTPFLISHLGKQSYGVWILVFTFSLSGFLSLFDLGLQQTTVKFVAEHLANRDRRALNAVIGQSLLLYPLIGVLAALVTLSVVAIGPGVLFNIAPGFEDQTMAMLIIIAIAAVIDFTGMAFVGIIRGRDRLDVVMNIDTLLAFLRAAVLVVVVLLQMGLVIMVLSVTIVGVLRLLILSFASRRILPGQTPTFIHSYACWHKFLSFTGYVAVMKISSFVWLSIDRALIALLLVSTVLTDYDVAYKLHQAALAMCYLVSHSILPMASYASARNDKQALQRMCLSGTKFSVMITMPMVLIAVVAADDFIRCWVGPEFMDDVFPARVFLAHFAITSLTAVPNVIVQGIGNVRRTAVAALLAAACNIVFSATLCIPMGLIGLAIGTAASVVASMVIIMPWTLRELDISWTRFFGVAILKTYPAVLLGGALAYLLLRVTRPETLLGVAMCGGGALAAAATCFLLTGATDSERGKVIEFLRNTLG